MRELVREGHSVFGFDLRPTPGLPEGRSIVGSLLDPSLLLRSVSGVDAVIHLAATPDDAAFPRPEAPKDQDNFESELVPNNIVAGYRVLEAARKCGTERVILASTGQVIDGHLDAGNVPVVASASFQPRYLYACTKVFLEMLGRVYSEQHGLKVLSVRLGWCPRDAGQVALIRSSPEDQDVFLSPGDAGRFFAAAASCDCSKWPAGAVAYCTSLPAGRWLYDLESAKRLIGFAPQDRWPTGAEEFGT